MPLSARVTAPAVLLAAAGLTAVTACAPSTSVTGARGDARTGTLRVWLFREVDNKPKEAVAREAVAAFTRNHPGVRVDVAYIPVDTRAQRIKAAFNDPKSAPDLVEYGNTDTAGYVRDGGLADVTADLATWADAKDTDPAAKRSVTVDGKQYGAPLFVGVRALYYRTDVFRELGLKPPGTLAELAATARKVHKERPGLYGLVVGGAYTYGAMPFVWAHGGDMAERHGRRYVSALDGDAAKKGIKAYTDLFGDDNCPVSKCARMGGNDTVQAFASGKAAMAIGGDFSHRAVENGKVKGAYAVVPLPGVRRGQIAPAFAGGNNLGVLKSSAHRTLAVDLMKSLAGKRTQARLFDAMGFLPTYTDVRREAARRQPFALPFVRTLAAGARSVPASPGWAAVDAGQVLPTLFQEVVSGRGSVDAAAGRAARKMNEAFAK
ncbi:extracellular solute-binding protein [Streptomyces netropsis]|uniref:N,N'-diacetylchitobiose transport system substrate-binding protein n=1 Tax=Streptomyces netropsis TaxID=55404 RepID=A0A7W7PBY1_STRNE|nr:extracellular solute-binding protein [Streptomyces netropsis]MBB4883997.1 N,N'-diacetylchitobiose transport system substrate-binding protein [Streptomyces netropsis]GGR06863.1 ABC transporter substrate-binding protein [Streptomyces netropsis]